MHRDSLPLGQTYGHKMGWQARSRRAGDADGPTVAGSAPSVPDTPPRAGPFHSPKPKAKGKKQKEEEIRMLSFSFCFFPFAFGLTDRMSLLALSGRSRTTILDRASTTGRRQSQRS